MRSRPAKARALLGLSMVMGGWAFVGACQKTAACRPGTLLLTIDLEGTALTADHVQVDVEIDGVAGPINSPIPTDGPTMVVQVDFPHNYPASNKPVSVTVTALKDNVSVGSSTIPMKPLNPGCEVWPIDLGGSDGSASSGGGAAGTKLGGTDGAAGNGPETRNDGGGGGSNPIPGTGGGAGASATGTGGGGGRSGAGGSVAGATGSAGHTGSAGTGGAAGSPGTAMDGGVDRPTHSGSGGTGGGTGPIGGMTGAGGGPASGMIPAGYPTPTAANRSLCTTVPVTTTSAGASFCPGGGAGPVCIECLFGGDTYTTTNVATSQGTMEAGNYAVTVTLGGAAAGQTQIDAEANRTLVAATATAPGASVTYSFVVNVRAKEGQPTQNVAAGYPGLDLFFSGPTASPPQVSAVGYALVSAATKPVMIYIASDSTACDETDQDYAGWGQMLPRFFAPPAGVANYADSGESSASFFNNSAEWGAIKDAMVAGDWVLIQFGDDDSSTTSAAFQANLTQMVQDAKAKGATPIVVSAPARASFIGGTLNSQSNLHGADTQAVATAQNVAFIDLTSITSAWYSQLGANGWQQYHALGTDVTHTNAAGADTIAGFVAAAIQSQKLGLAPYLRP